MSRQFIKTAIPKTEKFAIYELSRPDQPEQEAPTRTIAVCPDRITSNLVCAALNHCCDFSPALQEDSGAWTVSPDSLHGTDPNIAISLDMQQRFTLPIYRRDDNDPSSDTLIAQAETDEDRQFITASLNHCCERSAASRPYFSLPASDIPHHDHPL
jgi:hypothetical protein